MVYRDSYYNEEMAKPDMADLDDRKNRHSPSGDISLRFNQEEDVLLVRHLIETTSGAVYRSYNGSPEIRMRSQEFFVGIGNNGWWTPGQWK